MKQLPGQLRVVFKHFPLTSIHKNARPAALAAMAAQRQGKFWDYHDMLFQNQQKLEGSDLVAWARVVGLNEAQFVKDMADPALADRLAAEVREATLAGVQGTPTLFLNGRRVKGSIDSADKLVDLVKSEVLKAE